MKQIVIHSKRSGEIATILTFAALVVIGISTIISTAFLKSDKNKIATNPRAQACGDYDEVTGQFIPCPTSVSESLTSIPVDSTILTTPTIPPQTPVIITPSKSGCDECQKSNPKDPDMCSEVCGTSVPATANIGKLADSTCVPGDSRPSCKLIEDYCKQAENTKNKECTEDLVSWNNICTCIEGGPMNGKLIGACSKEAVQLAAQYGDCLKAQKQVNIGVKIPNGDPKALIRVIVPKVLAPNPAGVTNNEQLPPGAFRRNITNVGGNVVKFDIIDLDPELGTYNPQNFERCNRNPDGSQTGCKKFDLVGATINSFEPNNHTFSVNVPIEGQNVEVCIDRPIKDYPKHKKCYPIR